MVRVVAHDVDDQGGVHVHGAVAVNDHVNGQVNVNVKVHDHMAPAIRDRP